MTAATAGAAGDGSRRLRLGMWLGHYFTAAAPFLALGILVNHLAQLWMPDDGIVPIIVGSIGLVSAALLIAMLLCRDLVHARHMCERDLAASRILLDPQGEVQKRRHLLKMNHQRRWWWLFLTSAAVLILFGVFGNLGDHLPLAVRIVFTVVDVAAAIAIGYTLRAMYVHQRLQPWCPWCDHGRGDDETTPAPDPVPSGTING